MTNDPDSPVDSRPKRPEAVSKALDIFSDAWSFAVL